MSEASLGRIRMPPHPILFELLYEPQLADDRRHVLPFLLRIDAAHLVMLAHRGIVPEATASALLTVNRELSDRVARGQSICDGGEPHRGLYVLYEHEYVERLGSMVGGAAHVARSRNDIAATSARMRMRDELLSVLDAGSALVRTLCASAAAHVETVVPGFTHLEPAQPTTMGHYLAAAADNLQRSLEWLLRCYDLVDRCPLGAAAGFGTSFAIDPQESARLLGFRDPIANSTDAVASRDYVIYVLASLAAIGSVLTRIAADLQAWGSSAYGFLEWPDDLVSTSSIMPQKRNLFAFENLRSLAGEPLGALVNSVLTMKNAPFTNSIEVSAAAGGTLWTAVAGCRSAVRLADLLIGGFTVRADRIQAFFASTCTTMTAVADLLVRECGLPFRAAHEIVSRAVAAFEREGPPSADALKAMLEAAAIEWHGAAVTIEPDALGRALDPFDIVSSARFGGGPSPASVRPHVDSLRRRVEALAQSVADARDRLQTAQRLLNAMIADLQAHASISG